MSSSAPDERMIKDIDKAFNHAHRIFLLYGGIR